MLQKFQQDVVGYKLYDFGTHYELHFKFGVYRGSLKQVCTYAVLEHDFDIKEIEIGVLEMNKHFHNAAEYGIFKRFMWTFDKETNQGLH